MDKNFEHARQLYEFANAKRNENPKIETLCKSLEELYPELTQKKETIQALTYLVNTWRHNSNKTVNGIPFAQVEGWLSKRGSISFAEENALKNEIEACSNEERMALLESLYEKII